MSRTGVPFRSAFGDGFGDGDLNNPYDKIFARDWRACNLVLTECSKGREEEEEEQEEKEASASGDGFGEGDLNSPYKTLQADPGTHPTALPCSCSFLRHLPVHAVHGQQLNGGPTMTGSPCCVF